MSSSGENAGLNESKLQEILCRKTPELRRFLEIRIPAKFRSIISADDILQEVYIAAFKGLPSLRSTAVYSIERWLAVILQRQLVNSIKSANRAKRGRDVVLFRDCEDRKSSLVGIWDRVIASERSPSNAAVATEIACTVQIALASLPESRRIALSLHFLDGKSFEEIATVMHKSAPAVRSLLFNGLRQLRERLGTASQFMVLGPSSPGRGTGLVARG